MPAEDALTGLRKRYRHLENELTSMQQQHEALNAEHGQKCLTLLEAAMRSLFEVILCVRKADKKMIAWHHRSDTLKSMLRHVGIDRRTEVMIERKTQKLKAKVSDVENKFDSANGAVGKGLAQTESLKTKFVEFSQKSMDQVSKETLAARDKLDSSKEGIETRMAEQRTMRKAAQSQMSEAAQSVDEAKKKHDEAVLARGILAAGSLVGLGVAAVAAVACPTSLLFTGSALVAASTGGMACAVNKDVEILEAKHEALSSVLSEHENSIKALEAKMLALNKQRGECASDIQLVKSLQTKAADFRKVVQANLDYMRETKLSLEKMSLRLREIIRKLQECQYEEARRGIAERLQEVLMTIQAVPKKRLTGIKEKEVRKAMLYLTDIEKRTTEVLRISAVVNVT